MKNFKYFDIIICFVVLLAGVYIHIISNLGFDLSKIPGDLGDSRFNNYILEHGYLYITGKVQYFWSAPFMYPEQNVIALSDNLIGSMPFYAIYRFLGINTETSFQLWFITITLLNYASATFVFYKLTKNLSIASLGAYIFAFSLVMFGQYTHLQVIPKFIIPFAFYFTILFFRNYQLKYFLFALLSLVYQFYCGIYLGFLLSLGFGFYFLLNIIAKNKQFFVFFKQQKFTLMFLGCILLSGLLLYPLMMPYYKMSKLLGVREFAFIFDTLPTIKSYFYIPKGSILWHFLEKTGESIPYNWEHYLFVGGIPILSLLIFILFIKKFNSENKMMAFSLILILLFTIKIGNFTIYKLIYFIPGFGSLRAIGRVVHLELFFYAMILVSVLLFFYNKVRFNKIFIITILLLIIADQFIDKTIAINYNKENAQNRTKEIVNLLENKNVKQYNAFAICVKNKEELYKYNIDAMIASQVVNKPTINGYSGTCMGKNCDFIVNLDTISLYDYLNFNWIKKNEVLVIQR